MKSTKFFIRMLAVFFTRVKPASTSANPGCMKNTSMAASIIHTVFNPLASSSTVFGGVSVSGTSIVVAAISITAIVDVADASLMAVDIS